MAISSAASPSGILKNKLFTGSATYLIASVISSAIPLALLPVLTRYLSPDEYGQVAMFHVLVSILTAFTGLSMHGAANRKYFDKKVTDAEIRRFIGSCMQILLVSTSLVLMLVLAFDETLQSWAGLETRWLVLAAIMSAAGVVLQIRLGQYQVRSKPLKFGAVQISMAVTNLSLSLLLVVVLLYGVQGRILGQVVSTIILSLVALYLLRKDGLLAWSGRPEYRKEALQFGIPLIPHVAGLLLLNIADRVVIKSALGLDAAGIYMVALQITMGLGIIFGAINQAYVPWLFEKLRDDDVAEKRRIVLYTYVYFAVILVVAGLAFIIGPPMVALIAGEGYSAAGEVIGWLALGQVFNGMYLMVTNYIFFSKRTGLLSVASIGAGALNVLLLVVMIRMYGLQGAAIAFSVAMLVRFLAVWFIASFRHPMPWLNPARIQI